ncbi:MAG TPA: hypothetical protein VHM31_06800, partial [Polyangia bacterium]|nr:hypothetical protein [Polyangia bacterium]
MTRRPIVFGAVAVGAALIALGPIADGDIYWHVAAGREIWHRGALLRTDPFTSSAAGRAWIDVHWLFQVAIAAVYGAFGAAGLAVAKALAVAVGATVATRAAERGGGAVARDGCAVAALTLLFLARHLLPVRPVLVTLVLLAAFLLILEANRTDPGSRSARRATLVALPLLQLVWVNCQGLAPLGPALVGCYLLGALLPNGDRRAALPLGLALAGCLLASFGTPYGLSAAALPVRLLGRITPGNNIFSTAIAENVPPLVLDRTSPEMTAHLRAILILTAAALVVIRPSLPVPHVLALAAFAGLALMANRNVILFYWLLAPLGAIALAPAAARRLASLRA